MRSNCGRVGFVMGAMVGAVLLAAMASSPATAGPRARRSRPAARTQGPAAVQPVRDPEAAASGLLAQVTDDLWASCDKYFHNGDFESSQRIGRLVIRLDPKHIDACNTTAWLLRQGLDRPEDALWLHHRTVRNNMENYEASFDLGIFHFDRKEFPLAVRYLTEAAAHADAPSKVHHMLAHAYERQDMREEAMRVWRRDIEKFPDDQVARRNLERLENEQ